MKCLAMQCRNCGAPLEFSSKATHVRCRYCDSLMLLRKATLPAQLDLIERGLLIDHIMTADSDLIAMKTQLKTLDEAWQQNRDDNLHDLNPQAFRIIGESDWIVVGLALFTILVFCAMAMRFAGANGLILLLLFAVLPVIFFLAHGGLNPIASVKYLRQRHAYEYERSKLVDQIRMHFAKCGISSEEVDLMPDGDAGAMKE